jgi:hypothetical protein
MMPTAGIWYTPQAFSRESWATGKTDYRSPTYQETRCAQYLAIVAGATGILSYKIGDMTLKYGTRNGNTGIFHSPEMKLGFLNGMGPEINSMSKVLLADTHSGFVAASNQKIKLLTKQYHGKKFIIAVNPKPEKIGKVTLKLSSTKASQMQVLFEGRKVRVINNSIDDEFLPFAVHIYTDDLKFKNVIDINKIKEQIAQEQKN